MPVEFTPVAPLSSDDGGTTFDYARSRGRWQALPDGWLSLALMREALKQVCRIPDWDDAAAEAALWAMGDFLETRGSGHAREYRRVETLPEPMSPAQIFEAEAARRAELERERFEREEQARLSVSAERDRVYLENNRAVHRELADEYTVPMIRALAARVAQLEAQPAQHGELEVAGAVSTPTATAAASEAPAEPGRAERVRRWMFGDADDADDAEIERPLEQDEEDGKGDE
jgi:hypothetical protein